MVFAVHRGFIVLVCIGLLVFQTQTIAGLTGIDLALSPFVKHSRILKAVAVDSLRSRKSLACAPSMVFDPNQSNKRRVKKGSDPIHNRC